MDTRVRRIAEADRAEWVRMRHALWPDDSDAHDRETREHFESHAQFPIVFVAEVEGMVVGFLELGQRPYAEGCESSPVPFIEGWFVEPAYHRRGIGRALVHAAEASARADGYTEIASDVLIDNDASIMAHKALGYAEVERRVCFRKALFQRPTRRDVASGRR
jgi:aminoglycoside 6'-N-acetyltransferase I